MGIVDKFRDFIGVPDDEFYDEREVDLIGATDDTSAKSQARISHINNSPASSSSRVLNIPATTQLQVVLVKPEHLEDASPIADQLNERNTVVLNLELAGKDESRRLLDFLSGVAYANHGKISKIANSTYIITPSNVDIRGELLDELENNGVIF